MLTVDFFLCIGFQYNLFSFCDILIWSHSRFPFHHQFHVTSRKLSFVV